MEPQTGSKLGKEYLKAVYCHPAYLTYMQSISCEKAEEPEIKLPAFMDYVKAFDCVDHNKPENS